MEHIITQINAQTDKVEDWSCLPEDPLVSVFMTTYNHGRFIAQALDGILMQEVDFSYEIVIGEDKSTDRTRRSYVSISENIRPKFASGCPGRISIAKA